MPPRLFDHEEARRRYDNGERIFELARAYGVHSSSMRHVVTRDRGKKYPQLTFITNRQLTVLLNQEAENREVQRSVLIRDILEEYFASKGIIPKKKKNTKSIGWGRNGDS